MNEEWKAWAKKYLTKVGSTTIEITKEEAEEIVDLYNVATFEGARQEGESNLVRRIFAKWPDLKDRE